MLTVMGLHDSLEMVSEEEVIIVTFTLVHYSCQMDHSTITVIKVVPTVLLQNQKHSGMVKRSFRGSYQIHHFMVMVKKRHSLLQSQMDHFVGLEHYLQRGNFVRILLLKPLHCNLGFVIIIDPD